MMPKFAPQFVDRIYAEADIYEFWTALTMVEGHAKLPPATWLFCRLYEWMSYTRAGIWTYYEGTPETSQQKILMMLPGFPTLAPLAEQYMKGRQTWTNTEEICEVDVWIDANGRDAEALLLHLARNERTEVERLLFTESRSTE